MRWHLLSNHNGHQNYELLKNEEKIATLQYDINLQALRLNAYGYQRVFFLRKEGMLRQKNVLRNEYGFKIGQFVLAADGKKGMIELDEEKFLFTYKQNMEEMELVKAGDGKNIFSFTVSRQISQFTVAVLAIISAKYVLVTTNVTSII
ncbi:MAG: hypothetical protein C4308_03535 [Chitinophagaceae bacterium]